MKKLNINEVTELENGTKVFLVNKPTKVKFIDVGIKKESWEATCYGKVTYEWLHSQASKALFSSNLMFSDQGTIFAGWNAVGKFEIVKD